MNTSKTIAVINCGSKKQSQACEAKNMYSGGNLFDTMKQFVEQEYEDYLIVSGKYGILEPDEIIEPYEDVVFFVQKIFRERAKKQGKVLTAVSKTEQDVWAKKVWESRDWNQYDKVDFYINIYYWEPLKKYFTDETKFQHHKFSRQLGPNLKKFKEINQQKTSKVNNQNNFFQW